MENILTTKKEEAKIKAGELSKQFNCVVHPIVFVSETDPNDVIIGFVKEPPRAVKLQMMDKALTSAVTAASNVLDAYLIREASDERIYSENPANDSYYIGASMVVYEMVKMAVDQFKKK